MSAGIPAAIVVFGPFDLAALNVCLFVHILQAVSAHHMWLSYLIELWSIVSPLGDDRASAAQHQFGRLLHASLQDPSVLTHHPAAVGAYFRLLQLGLAYSRSLLLPGVGLIRQATPTLLLFDQILRAVSDNSNGIP